jgi:hypothetical protein
MQNNQNVKSTSTVATPLKGKSTRFSSTSGRDGKHTSTAGHGKSRFAQKSRSKKQQKPVALKRGPVNSYTSVCCSVPAKKPHAGELPAGKKERLGLGSWRCTACGKSCKVTVSKYHVATVVGENVTITAMVSAEVPNAG